MLFLLRLLDSIDLILGDMAILLDYILHHLKIRVTTRILVLKPFGDGIDAFPLGMLHKETHVGYDDSWGSVVSGGTVDENCKLLDYQHSV
jgi:hypothetical protein